MTETRDRLKKSDLTVSRVREADARGSTGPYNGLRKTREALDEVIEQREQQIAATLRKGGLRKPLCLLCARKFDRLDRNGVDPASLGRRALVFFFRLLGCHTEN